MHVGQIASKETDKVLVHEKLNASFLWTLGSCLLMPIIIVLIHDLPIWIVTVWLPVIAIFPALSLFAGLRMMTKRDLEGLPNITQDALGIKSGFLASVFATLALTFADGFRFGLTVITFVMFGMEFMFAGMLVLAAAMESVLEFRLWMGNRKIDELDLDELSTVWVGSRTARRNFRTHFWTLVPLYLRGTRNVGTIPILGRENISILIILVLVALIPGSQPWGNLVLAGAISTTMLNISCAYAYRASLAPYDGKKLKSIQQRLQNPTTAKAQNEL